ncbi:MAG: hypothetical protein NTU99_14390 [Pseudanabaena sp. LacPavin_0818_WC45_MAG_42_6]|nr:hypothetical protein [Pseudanabaena sp. LacPavin_0818_WC45_MAG_42_6]
MLGYGNCLRVSMPRMESLPESSQPHGDLVKKDRKLQLGDQVNHQSELAISDLPEIDPRDRFTWSNFFVVVSIPLVGGLLGIGLIYLANPLAISWLASSDAPAFYSNSLWNIPKSIPKVSRKSKLSWGAVT